jgi:predicted nucleotide-binding protein
LRTAIQSALQDSGLHPYFADKEVVEGQIFLNKILPKIRNSRFGIYDISNPEKPNVFIELGAAIAIGARYYIIVRKGVTVPSDLLGLDRIEYQSFEHLKSELRQKIKPG